MTQHLMPALTPAQVLAIVSDLARDRSVVDVAARHHVAADVVAMVRADFGPGLGQLAKSAKKLRAEQGHRSKIAGLEAIAKKRADELAAAKKALAEAKGKKAAHNDNATIRAWAKTQGLTVGANGRIPQAIRDQYEAAQA